MTGHLELWVLGLLAAVAGLVMLSNRLGVPYPVFLVLGGLALGLIPIVPEIGLPPDLILLIFLPPLLYSAAFFSGAISLAAALAIPLTIQNGASFPGRDEILFLTFCVILVTLVVQGISLPLLIRRLGLAEAEGEEEREETEARLRAAEAALVRLDELADEGQVREDTAERMRELYEYRRRRFAARHSEQAESGEEDNGYEERSLAYQRFRRELLGAEREELLRLRREGRISDEVRRRVERDLDLEDARLEI
jgi:monovalent cation/hydrogen antiporter